MDGAAHRVGLLEKSTGPSDPEGWGEGRAALRLIDRFQNAPSFPSLPTVINCVPTSLSHPRNMGTISQHVSESPVTIPDA